MPPMCSSNSITRPRGDLRARGVARHLDRLGDLHADPLQRVE